MYPWVPSLHTSKYATGKTVASVSLSWRNVFSLSGLDSYCCSRTTTTGTTTSLIVGTTLLVIFIIIVVRTNV